jgi:hypothetical protein
LPKITTPARRSRATRPLSVVPRKVAGAGDGWEASGRSAQIFHQEGHPDEWRSRIEPRHRCPDRKSVV